MTEVEFYDMPWGKEAQCKKCGSSVYWQECWNCEEGYSYHDCGEDICCCLDPQPNVVCDVCDGEGGWYVCPECENNKNTSPSALERNGQTEVKE